MISPGTFVTHIVMGFILLYNYCCFCDTGLCFYDIYYILHKKAVKALIKIYLDNYCYNRTFDDQTLVNEMGGVSS